jgi:hypothetical protein
VLVASTPTDRALAAEGSTLWAVRAADVGSTVDALVRAGRVLDAIGLVEAVGESHANLAPTQQLAHLRVLHAIAQFARGEYKPALEALLRHNVHPARVVALYPPEVAGELAVPREQWMQLFGAVAGARFEPLQDDKDKDKVKASASGLPLPLRNAHLSLGRKRSNDTLRSVSSVTSASVAVADRPMSPDGGAAAPSSPARPSAGTIAGLPRAAIDELIYYLSDRRQKLTGITPTAALPREADLPPLSDVPMDEIHALPDGPLSDLLGEQLLRTAQVVYTSLLRVYLLARPSLVGSLCRIENWCDVAQAEPLLRAKGRIDDLRDLYMQKQMHDKALSMLYE